MITSFQVVDDFCDRFSDLKASAFRSGFGTWAPSKGEVGSSKYEGMNFWGDHALGIYALSNAIGDSVFPNSLFFRVTNKDTERAYIHSDRHSGNHTCILYLSKHDDATGTAFWRHRRTGLTYMPPIYEQKKDGIFDELKSDMVTGDPTKWEQLDLVRAVENRALLFQAPLFHSRWPLDGFGEGQGENGRLVWVCHYYRLGKNGQLY